MNDLIKQDINFLEYPLYILKEKSLKEDINVVIGDKEYNLLVGYKTPTSMDILFLYYFINILQKSNYSTEKLKIKQSSLIKDLFASRSSFYYLKLKESLKIWRNIGMSFRGSFYDGKEYLAMEFGILNTGKINKDGLVEVEFNDIFLSILKNTNFYRYININEFMELKKPISRRLYEILKKSSFPYKIEISKLAKKIPLKQKYASQIMQKIKPAIKEINEKTDLKIDLSLYKNDSSEFICIFEKKLENNLLENHEILSNNNIVFENLLMKIPTLKKTSKVKALIKSYVNNNNNIDIAYIESNIKYSIINSSKNFYLYLMNALEKDYAKELREIESLRKEEEKTKLKQEIIIQLKNEEELAFNEDCKAFISALSSEEYTKYALIAKEEIIQEWSSKGFQNITGNSFIPTHLIEERIYTTYLKNNKK